MFDSNNFLLFLINTTLLHDLESMRGKKDRWCGKKLNPSLEPVISEHQLDFFFFFFFLCFPNRVDYHEQSQTEIGC